MSAVTKPIILNETGERIATAIEALEAIGRPTQEQTDLAVSEWLDDHPEATTTVDFAIATKVFPTVAAMVADTSLKNGDNVATRGYYASGDNGGANYVVSSSHTGVFYITLGNGLYANMLSEKGILPVETIGIKGYASSTDNPDENDMDRNVELFNTAHYNGIFLMFGRGHYYFSSPLLLAHYHSHTIQGLDRNLSFLHFPNSNGIYFCDPSYYNYYVIKKLQIRSYGHCIVCDESCMTVLDSHFEWLILNSETGDCFHGPRYNVAKYERQGGGGTIYDTCVQNAVFDFINATAPLGAAFANITGMYTYYMHLNFVTCKYAFRNCDGIVEQANTLGTTPEYYIYYDKCISYSLRWTFINVNAEVLRKAFIYTEPKVEPGEGEDPRKPETANMMAIASLTAINSEWSLDSNVVDNDVYPITVHSINRINLMNSSGIVKPSAYPNSYDTDVVKAHIKCTNSPGLTYYNGGPDITVYDSNSNQMVTRYGNNIERIALGIGTNGGYAGLAHRNVPTYNELYANLIYGGKGLCVWSVKASELNSEIIQPPNDKTFYDVLEVNVDTNSNKSLITWQSTNNSIYPGRIITISNKSTSLKNLRLRSANDPNYSSYANYILSKDCLKTIELTPGECIHLVYTKESSPVNGNATFVWKPLDPKYNLNDPKYEELYNAIKATSSKTILPVTKGYYIKNASSTIDVNSLVEGKVTNANYGIKNVLVACEQGDEFTIINGVGASQNTILWSFVKADGTRLANSGTYAVAENETITAPANAAYLVVNSFKFPIVFKSN